MSVGQSEMRLALEQFHVLIDFPAANVVEREPMVQAKKMEMISTGIAVTNPMMITMPRLSEIPRLPAAAMGPIAVKLRH